MWPQISYHISAFKDFLCTFRVKGHFNDIHLINPHQNNTQSAGTNWKINKIRVFLLSSTYNNWFAICINEMTTIAYFVLNYWARMFRIQDSTFYRRVITYPHGGPPLRQGQCQWWGSFLRPGSGEDLINYSGFCSIKNLMWCKWNVKYSNWKK